MMLMLNRLLIIFLFLTSCGFKATTKIVSIDPAMQEYVDQFVSEGKTEGVTLVIDSLSLHFQPTLPGDVVGRCYMRGIAWSGVPTVQIDKEYWDDANEVERTVLIFHELGHCVLFRQHIDTWTNGIATSIMYHYLENDYMYSNNWAYYMHEMFHGY